VSLVDFTTPNEHTRLIRKDDLDKLRRDDTVDALPFEGSPYVLLSTQVLDTGISDYHLAITRYGRVDTIGEKPFWLIDGFSHETDLARGIFANLSAELPQTGPHRDIGAGLAGYCYTQNCQICV